MPPNHEKPQNKKGSYFRNYLIQRAENGTRTRDPQLGRLVLYQLSYFRKSGQWWIRTTAGVSQLSYSQPHLATLVTALVLKNSLLFCGYKYRTFSIRCKILNTKIQWIICENSTYSPISLTTKLIFTYGVYIHVYTKRRFFWLCQKKIGETCGFWFVLCWLAHLRYWLAELRSWQKIPFQNRRSANQKSEEFHQSGAWKAPPIKNEVTLIQVYLHLV